jgi:coenzyme F420-0:L-glutamate ligase/coenzyme F420-1:gamma-L-glutamate ligase
LMRAEELLRVIEARASSKLLTPGRVEYSDVVRALRVAISAPSAHNSQPWRVVVIDDREVIKRLLEEMASEWERDLAMDGLPRWKIDTIINESKKRTLRASIVIVVCLSMEGMDVYPDERRQGYEYVMAVQSVAAFIENLLLALHVLGYGACWRCGPLFAPDAVRRVLAIPPDIIPQALVEVGLPGGARPKSRKQLSEIAFRNRWGAPL